MFSSVKNYNNPSAPLLQLTGWDEVMGMKAERLQIRRFTDLITNTLSSHF